MLACVDTYYSGQRGHCACLTFEQWTDAIPLEEYRASVFPIEAYVPGQFYRRELPCVLAVLRELADPISTVVVDGYVWLDTQGTPGLGAHLHEALERRVAVIGVAKTKFRTADNARIVLRGKGKKPLYVTAVGLNQQIAADAVASMHGRHRIPTLLRRVDRLSKAPA